MSELIERNATCWTMELLVEWLNEYFLFFTLLLIKEKFSSTIDENFSILKIQRVIFIFTSFYPSWTTNDLNFEEKSILFSALIEVIFSLENSVHSNICLQMTKLSFNCSDQVKRSINVFSSVIRIKEKNLMLNGKFHSEEFFKHNSKKFLLSEKNTKSNVSSLKGNFFFLSNISYLNRWKDLFSFQLNEIDRCTNKTTNCKNNI